MRPRVWASLGVHTSIMWTYLSTWMLQDGEIPEVRPGQRLSGVGVRAACWSIVESSGSGGVRVGKGPDPDGFLTAHYEVTGRVEWTQEPCSLSLDVNGLHLLAEPNAVRKVFTGAPQAWNPRSGVWERPYGLEPYRSDFPLPTVGSTVTVEGNLAVLGDYEWDAFGFPDLRADWIVQGVKIEYRSHREVLGSSDGPSVGEVVKVEAVDQASRRIQDRAKMRTSYLLDLTSANSEAMP
jgi:hypothetical protein